MKTEHPIILRAVIHARRAQCLAFKAAVCLTFVVCASATSRVAEAGENLLINGTFTEPSPALQDPSGEYGWERWDGEQDSFVNETVDCLEAEGDNLLNFYCRGVPTEIPGWDLVFSGNPEDPYPENLVYPAYKDYFNGTYAVDGNALDLGEGGAKIWQDFEIPDEAVVFRVQFMRAESYGSDFPEADVSFNGRILDTLTRATYNADEDPLGCPLGKIYNAWCETVAFFGCSPPRVAEADSGCVNALAPEAYTLVTSEVGRTGSIGFAGTAGTGFGYPFDGGMLVDEVEVHADETVEICHSTRHNPHTVVVTNGPAVLAHLRHQGATDRLGPCEDPWEYYEEDETGQAWEYHEEDETDLG